MEFFDNHKNQLKFKKMRKIKKTKLKLFTATIALTILCNLAHSVQITQHVLIKNDILDSPLTALLIYPTDRWSEDDLGPRIVAQYKDSSTQEFHKRQAALFLNEVTGRTLLSRSVSQEVESQVLTQLSDFFVLKDDKYVYVGPESPYVGLLDRITPTWTLGYENPTKRKRIDFDESFSDFDLEERRMYDFMNDYKQKVRFAMLTADCTEIKRLKNCVKGILNIDNEKMLHKAKEAYNEILSMPNMPLIVEKYEKLGKSLIEKKELLYGMSLELDEIEMLIDKLKNNEELFDEKDEKHWRELSVKFEVNL